MIPVFPISEETLKALANAHQGPPKPVPKWKKATAAVLRGVIYVLASPMTLIVLVGMAFLWAFEVKDES